MEVLPLNKSKPTPDKFIQHAGIMKALAHPTRLFIVDELSKGDLCVCELTDMIGADISTVSKHLAVLKKAGLLKDRKEGSKVFYSLVIPCAMKFFDCVDSVCAHSDKTTVAEHCIND
jgi:DNA-binding transcriptional ArsR family regulator